MTIEDAWGFAIDTVAAVHQVDPQALRAPSRGRGPRPKRELWEPKRLAIWLTVALADCSYAELGRAIGLSRDTVTTHCEAVRARCATDADYEAELRVLERMAAAATSSEVRALNWRICTLEARLADIEALVMRAGLHPTHPTEPNSHENVIKMAGGRR